MSTSSPAKNIKNRIFKRGNNLSNFQEILRQKCHQRIREKRGQLFNRGRSGLLSAEDLQETLTEIVRQEFNNLATSENSEISINTKEVINYPLNQDEALKLESEILAEQEQWLMQEYEQWMNNEEEMFDALEDDVICPMCLKAFLEEIPDFIVCNLCGLKIHSEITIKKFKYNLDLYVNMHSQNCHKVPDFSLVPEDNNISLFISCTACSNCYLVKTIES